MHPQVKQLARSVAIALSQLKVSDPETTVVNLLSSRQATDNGCTLFATESEGDTINLRIGPSRYEFEPVSVFGRSQKMYCISGIVEIIDCGERKELRPGASVVTDEGGTLSGTAWSNFTVVEVNRSHSREDGDGVVQAQ